MTDDDIDEFSRTLLAVYALYRLDCSSAVLTIWRKALTPYDLAAVQDALSRYCVNPDTGQFIPKPADVVKLIDGSTMDAANTAWTKVERAMSSVGTYATVVFDDPLIHVVVAEMGGWAHLGKVSVEEWPFRGNEFRTRYRAAKMKGETPAHPPKLIGIFDGENVTQTQPVLIGNRERARAVMRGGSDRPLLEFTQEATS